MATQRNHTGYSGQMAVLAEILFRKCNAAIPVIDVGTDVFAFRDDSTEVARIQVKAAQGTRYKKGGGYRAQFNISMKQLKATDNPALHYVLAVRLEDQWVSFLVLSRKQLKRFLYGARSFGIDQADSGELALKVRYQPDTQRPSHLNVRCGEVELDDYLNAWEQLPPVRPRPSQASSGGAVLSPA
jgi:hypothetical protein